MAVFIGDVHGKYEPYKRLIRQATDTIQVGDMGLGFRKWPHGEWRQNPPYDEMVKANARFIRGNHDNPEVCRNHTQWIQDGLVRDDMMFVGGAVSIDKPWRVKDFNWWEDEQLSSASFENLMGVYAAAKPLVMITHDCPKSVIPLLHSHLFGDDSITQNSLQKMLEIHRPKLWVFGHHHMSFDRVESGTRFVCLAELEMRELTW